MRRSARRRAAGFTLIEVTIALALTALTALLLAAALRGGIDSMFRLERHQDRVEETRDAAHFLRRIIHLAPAAGMIRRGRVELFFEGASNRLSVPVESARGLLVMQIEVAADRLVLRETIPSVMALEGAAQAVPPPVVLLAGVQSLNLAYSDGSDWLPAWPHRDRLPIAVRIGVVMADGESRPEQIVDLAMAFPR